MKIQGLVLVWILLLSGCLGEDTPKARGEVSSPAETGASSNALQEEAASASSMIVGKPAPDFTLPDKDGAEVTLSSFRGMWVALYFYPKDNTPGCTIEANDFTSLEGEFKKANAKIIGISGDSTQSHQNFAQAYDLKVDLLSDPAYQVMAEYGAWVNASIGQQQYGRVIRTTFLIGPDGIIRYHWPEVIPEGHAQRVLDKLRQLQG